MLRNWILWLAVLFTFSSFAESPLQPIKLDSPRDTFRSYLSAIEDYKKGLKTGDRKLLQRIDDAVRCFDLSEIPYLIRSEKAKQAAIFLKETIDRVIVIDFSKIPDDPETVRWRLKDTEIIIAKMESGDRAGEFLFSKETTFRAEEFYNKVKDLPYLKGSGQGAGYKEPWLQKVIPDWAQDELAGMAKWQWLGLLAAIFLGLFVKVIAESILMMIHRVSKLEDDTVRMQILRCLDKPAGLLLAVFVWYTSIHFLEIKGTPAAIILSGIQIVGSIAVIWGSYRMTDVLSEVLGRLADKTESDLDDQLVPLVSRSLRIFVVIIGVLATIQNLGFNVMSLLAGLGLGGLAFALAAKDTAANVFGSIMIILDRPFKIGDWIKAGSVEGTVEDIGFRSTRIRTFYSSQISIPNASLANLSIDNMGRRDYRRIYTTLGVTYDTTTEQMRKFIGGIKQIIADNEYTRKDYYHVVFKGYGASSLEVMVYFFLSVPDWTEELKQKEKIFLEIFEMAESLGVSFAFPTQTLHIESLPDKGNTNELNT